MSDVPIADAEGAPPHPTAASARVVYGPTVSVGPGFVMLMIGVVVLIAGLVGAFALANGPLATVNVNPFLDSLEETSFNGAAFAGLAAVAVVQSSVFFAFAWLMNHVSAIEERLARVES